MPSSHRILSSVIDARPSRSFLVTHSSAIVLKVLSAATLRARGGNPLFGSGIETCGELLLRLLAQFACRGNSDGRPGAEVKRLLPAGVAIVHPPELCSGRLNDEIESLCVGQLVGRFPRSGVRDLHVIQGHDGSSSKALSRTIKKTIKSDESLMVLAGSARIPLGDFHGKML